MAVKQGLLLDTSTFLWAGGNSSKLSSTARNLISDSERRLFVSVVSIWEMQIKHALGKLPLPANAHAIARRFAIALDADVLPLRVEHIATLYSLPPAHRDPFDRMIAAQAQAEGLKVVSPDAAFGLLTSNATW